MSTYRDAGVDIDAGARSVELIRDAVTATSTDAVLSDVGAFGGLYAADELGPGKVLVASTDGVGTKVELAARHGRWRGIGHDLVNHCVDDILVQGARPLFFLDYVATAELVPEVIAEVVGGVAEACAAAGCALLGGETAEMPGVYTPGAVDLAGTIVGVVDREDLLPRLDEMVEGDVLIGIPSDSPHTNGYSLIRRLIGDRDVDPALIDWLLTPHRNHAADIADLVSRGIRPKALAHITGGGFVDNIPRVLPAPLAAHIDLGSWKVPDEFARLVDWGSLEDSEAFRVWNMGIGMVVVISCDDAPDAGHPVIGEVVKTGDGRRVVLTGSWR